MKRLTARQYAQALFGAATESTTNQRPIVMRNFLEQLTRRRAMKLLPRILLHLQRMEDTTQRQTRVQAWAAQVIDVAALQATLQKALGPTVIEAATDATLLGGLKLQVGDEVIDGTLRSRLQRLHTHLSESS